ncbi:hypothetical protein MHU86_25574 [Fragilaria crotonensis]|nr:hypothetical protein MHU86_25574 [Fragilaria crotonensis]
MDVVLVPTRPGSPLLALLSRSRTGCRSWDGRDIRHCTSVSEPDGPLLKGPLVIGLEVCDIRRIICMGRLLRQRKEWLTQGGRCLLLWLWIVLNAPILQLLPLPVVTWKSQACQRQVPRRGGDDRKLGRDRGGGILMLHEAADDNDDDDDEDDGGAVPKFTEPLLPVESPHATYRIRR